jgi:hypothetical protein
VADRRLALLGGLVALLVAGCGRVESGMAVPAAPVDQSAGVISAYFDSLNAAGAQGAAAQEGFFRRTQDPEFPVTSCSLGGLTVLETPAWTTLRKDPGWLAPGTGEVPRGSIYRIAVSVSVQRNGVTVGDQVGTEHVVLLAGTGYGFAPCSTP